MAAIVLVCQIPVERPYSILLVVSTLIVAIDMDLWGGSQSNIKMCVVLHSNTVLAKRAVRYV